jgi:hypothetical protein
MIDRRLLRLGADRSVSQHADLAGALFRCNDMVVDAEGRAFVSNFGFDLYASMSGAPQWSSRRSC